MKYFGGGELGKTLLFSQLVLVFSWLSLCEHPATAGKCDLIFWRYSLIPSFSSVSPSLSHTQHSQLHTSSGAQRNWSVATLEKKLMASELLRQNIQIVKGHLVTVTLFRCWFQSVTNLLLCPKISLHSAPSWLPQFQLHCTFLLPGAYSCWAWCGLVYIFPSPHPACPWLWCSNGGPWRRIIFSSESHSIARCLLKNLQSSRYSGSLCMQSSPSLLYINSWRHLLE